MKMIFTGKVSGEKTELATGARHTVRARAGEQYGLVDTETGLVPAGVEADRSGDDLILRNKEEDTEVRIEGFWEECQPGETQCTAVFNVAGENGQVTEAVLTQDGPVLDDITAGQSGTLSDDLSGGLVWLGGLVFGGGLAGIALAAGGGGSSHHKHSTGTGIQVPDVNDANSNGKPDTVDAQEKAALDHAKALVAEAEAKQGEAKDALTKAQADNAINPQ
ncbi:putative RTX family exoprotein A protein, partial [Escherichia coli TA206]|uniref:GA-like domain-containing protein n=1 Tax=Escherichia coli TaxID=562 RepID=UPI0001E8A747